MLPSQGSPAGCWKYPLSMKPLLLTMLRYVESIHMSMLAVAAPVDLWRLLLSCCFSWVCRLGCSHICGTPAAIPILLSGTVGFVTAEVCELLNAVYVGGMLNSFLPSITIKASPKPFRVNVKSWCLLDLDPFSKNEWHLPRGKTNQNRKGDHMSASIPIANKSLWEEYWGLKSSFPSDVESPLYYLHSNHKDHSSLA